MELLPIVLVLGFFLPYLLAFAAVAYSDHKKAQKQRIGWQRLALANQLDFIPDGSWQQRPYVGGTYRDYDLELKIIQKGSGKRSIPGMQLVVSRPQSSDRGPKQSLPEPRLSFQEAINQFTPRDPRARLLGKIKATPDGRRLIYEQDGFETEAEQLQYLFDLLVNMANAYPSLIAYGGLAIPFLQKNAKLALVRGNNSLRPITLQLLQTITQGTARLADRTSGLLCIRCLARFQVHQIALGLGETVTYYGCRICSQSEQFVEWAGSVTAILDQARNDDLFRHAGRLGVNWSVRRALFDFEAVEIIQADDEAVERFAMQVNNDTDQWRQERYKDIVCTIFPDCQLSENTMRILQRTFGRIEVLPPSDGQQGAG